MNRRIPVWRYGPCKNSVQEGWKLCFAVFSVFFLCTGVHPHPPPTTYWCYERYNNYEDYVIYGYQVYDDCFC